MKFPEDVTLPFFSYGAFRPGEIAYLRIKSYVENIKKDSYVKGEILIRDGLPLLDLRNDKKVCGDILFFEPKAAGKAYYSIIELEPDKQYEWNIIEVHSKGDSIQSNVLIGKDLDNGCVQTDRPYKGKDDPLFKESFEIIEETLKIYSNRQSPNEPNPNFNNFLHLQMAFMLLWTSIERYATLRYSFGDNIMKKILKIASDEVFINCLKYHVDRKDTLYPTNNPSSDKKCKLDSNNPKKSLEYYYQIRCNITHRGKAAFEDFDRLKNSLSELNIIYKEVLKNAFKEAES